MNVTCRSWHVTHGKRWVNDMDMTGIVQMISSVGFPIVMCIILFNYVKETQAELTKAVNSLTTMVGELRDEIERMYKGVD